MKTKESVNKATLKIKAVTQKVAESAVKAAEATKVAAYNAGESVEALANNALEVTQDATSDVKDVINKK